MSDLILYTTEDGQTRLNLRADGPTVWLSQLEIAELFQTTKQNVSLHAKNIFKDGELRSDSVVKESLTTAADGKRYRTQLYNLYLCLTHDEIDTLNRLVVIFLEQAELRVKQRSDLTLDFWRENVDRMLQFNDQPVLQGPGLVSHEDMKLIAHDRYDAFDSNRRSAEAKEADAEDLKQIEDLDKKLTDSKNEKP